MEKESMKKKKEGCQWEKRIKKEKEYLHRMRCAWYTRPYGKKNNNKQTASRWCQLLLFIFSANTNIFFFQILVQNFSTCLFSFLFECVAIWSKISVFLLSLGLKRRKNLPIEQLKRKKRKKLFISLFHSHTLHSYIYIFVHFNSSLTYLRDS